MSTEECLHVKYGDAAKCGGEVLSRHPGLAMFSCQAHNDLVMAEWGRDCRAFQDELDAGHLDEYLHPTAEDTP